MIRERLESWPTAMYGNIMASGNNDVRAMNTFYIVKLGFAGLYLIFLFLVQNIDCGYSLEPPRRGGSNVYPQSMLFFFVFFCFCFFFFFFFR